MSKKMSSADFGRAVRLLRDHRALPVPVLTESRICFGIRWYASEVEAQIAAEAVQASDQRYNGGWFDGMRCGRETRFDTERDGRKLFAVTVA